MTRIAHTFLCSYSSVSPLSMHWLALWIVFPQAQTINSGDIYSTVVVLCGGELCIGLWKCLLGFLEMCLHICLRFSYDGNMVVGRLQRELWYLVSIKWDFFQCVCMHVGTCLYFAVLLDHAGLICPLSLDWNDCAVCLWCSLAVPAVTKLFLSTSFFISSHLAWFIDENVCSIHPVYIPELLVVPIGAYHFPSE